MKTERFMTAILTFLDDPGRKACRLGPGAKTGANLPRPAPRSRARRSGGPRTDHTAEHRRPVVADSCFDLGDLTAAEIVATAANLGMAHLWLCHHGKPGGTASSC
jgi:hypothetical protein